MESYGKTPLARRSPIAWGEQRYPHVSVVVIKDRNQNMNPQQECPNCLFLAKFMYNNIMQYHQWQAMATRNREFEPTVSIIVPVRNGETTMPTLMESLRKLNYNTEKLEFLVIDGNSTDKTKEVVKQYSINLMTQNGDGLNAARNTGIRNSKSEIIAFTDSDCVLPTDWVQNIVKNFSDPQIGCLGGNIKGCNGDFFSHYADNSLMPVLRLFKKREVLNSVKLLTRYPAGCNMAFRRKALEDAGGFDEGIRYAFDEDEVIERVCKVGYKMVLDPCCLVLHKHRSSLKELLKQTFRYGRGIGFLLKKKKTKDPISRWALLNLLGFLAWFSTAGALLPLILVSGWESLYIFPLSVALAPFLGLVAFYAYRAMRNGRLERVVIYPLIDILRLLAFSFGEIYQLFKGDK